MMELPSFLLFTPVPPRSQHNGWFPSLQRRFVVELARGAEPDEAARLVGKTRQTADRLRTRAGGESFAAAWDEAQAFAREVKAAGQGQIPVPASRLCWCLAIIAAGLSPSSSARMSPARCGSWPGSIGSPKPWPQRAGRAPLTSSASTPLTG
jgi:hypothetical protein